MTKRFQHHSRLRRQFLLEVKGRLENELGAYLESLGEISERARARNPQVGAVGFWAVIRLIMPPINAVAVVLYRNSQKSGPAKEREKFRRLLKNLNVPYPGIVLDMYRHALVHGDEMRGAIIKGHRISWVMSLGGAPHYFRKDTFQVDGTTLYRDFISFLDKEIQKSGNRKVWLEGDVVYTGTIPADLKAELDDLKLNGLD